MRVMFGPRARDQLARIFEYVATSNPAAAAHVVGRIQEVTERLATFPDSGRRASIGRNLRWIAVSDLPYLIFYTVKADGEVRIVRVLHASRQRRKP